MAQWRIDTQDYDQPTVTRFETVMQADQYGNIIGNAGSSYSAFGEPLVVEPEPVIQLDGLSGITSRDFEKFEATGGIANTNSNGTLMSCSTGTSIGGYGVLRSRRAVRYRPGQGAMARFTAKFTTSVDGNGNQIGISGYTQRAGFFAQEQALQVGFDSNSRFSILRQNGGKAHIEQITVTAAKTTGTEDITITLDDDQVIFTSSGTTTEEIAKEIYDALFADGTITSKWTLEWVNSKVCALARSIVSKPGTFSTTTDGGTTTFTNNTLQAYNANSNEWLDQTQFSHDTLDGNGPSGMTIDASKLNVFQIDYRWLGAGQISYCIEDGDGNIMPFHHEHYSNKNTDVHLDNPTMKIGYVAASLGGSGTNVIVEGGSLMGAIQGKINIASLPSAHSRDNVSLTQNQYTHIMTIKNRLLMNNKINLKEVILENISAGITVASGKAFGTVYLFYNATVSTDHVWQSINNESQIYYSDVDGQITLANEFPLMSFVIAQDSSLTFDLKNLRLHIPPNNEISVAIFTAATNVDCSVSLNWIED
jgi:hypothetical protein